MANQLNNLPTYPTPLEEAGKTASTWYFFFVGLFRGLAPEKEAAVTVGASPYTYSAPRGGFVIVSGGTVSVIAFSRDGTNFYTTGQTAGCFPISAADFLKITYTVLPTVTFVPT